MGRKWPSDKAQRRTDHRLAEQEALHVEDLQRFGSIEDEDDGPLPSPNWRWV